MPAVSKPKIVAMIVGSAIIMQQIDTTVITTALPQMAISLHSDPIRLSVAVTAYLLSLAVFVPVSGWAADRFGGRTIFRAAIALFTLGSILCGLSGNIVELTAARVLQGLGGAMMVPVGRLVLFRSLEKTALIGTMAYLQVPAQLGPVLGPPIGGFITTYFSWRWIFLVNVPLGILGIILVTIFFDNPKEETHRPFDWLGFVLTGAALFCLMYSIEAFGRGRGNITELIVLLVLGIVIRHAGAAPSVALAAPVARPVGLPHRHVSEQHHRRLAVPRRRRLAGFPVAAVAASGVRPLGFRVRHDHIRHRARLDLDEADGATDSAALRLSHGDHRQQRDQRRDHHHVRILHGSDADPGHFRAAADRRLLPVAAIHRDPGHDLCRRRATADELGDQHRQHVAAIEPRLRHFVRRGAC